MNQAQDIPQEITMALKDAGFRQELFKSKDPKDKLERKLGLTLPQGVKLGARQGDRTSELLTRLQSAQSGEFECDYLFRDGYTVTVCRQGGRIVVLEIVYD